MVAAVSMLSVQHILASYYNKRVTNANAYLCTLIIAATVLLFYAAIGKFSFSYDRASLLYGIGFGVAYCMGYIFELKALAVGSVSLTSLFLSYSLLIPTLFGVLYYHEKVTALFWVALVLLAVAMFLINYVPSQKGKEKQKFNRLWLLFTMLSFLGNGLCTIMQSLQQRSAGGLYRSEFMMYAMAVVIVCNLILTLLAEKKNHNTLSSLKKGWWCAILLGLMNAGTNLMVMLLVARNVLNLSLIYTLCSAGGLLLTFILARVVFKEKLRPMQIVGFFVGLCSVVLFNV